jgi:hypothetical protein
MVHLRKRFEGSPSASVHAGSEATVMRSEQRAQARGVVAGQHDGGESAQSCRVDGVGSLRANDLRQR